MSFVLLSLSQERFARNTIRELEDVDARELAIHRKVSRMNYSRRCAETLAVQAYQKRGLPLDPGMEIGFVVTDAAKVGSRSRKTCLGVRCRVLWKAAGKGVG